jgi:hypothetical protein
MSGKADLEREEFERWFSGGAGIFHDNLEKDVKGNYKQYQVHKEWCAWQAALIYRSKEVKALREALATISNYAKTSGDAQDWIYNETADKALEANYE